jgi:hypothetical protein
MPTAEFESRQSGRTVAETLAKSMTATYMTPTLFQAAIHNDETLALRFISENAEAPLIRPTDITPATIYLEP